MRDRLQVADQALQLGRVHRVAQLRQLEADQVHGRDLRDEGLGRRDADLEAGTRVQHAVRLTRDNAAKWNLKPNAIGMMGFSAGGHLAALAGNQPVPGTPDSPDPIERVSSKPDYMVLGYAWLGAISSDTSHLSYCKIFNLMDQCEALKTAYTPALFVTKDTPPTFMYHTYTDQTVPVQQALTFFDALVKNGVPAELHVFANGPHGTGLGKGDPALDQWPNLLEIWLRAQGLLNRAATPK